MANEFADKENALFLGRGTFYPVAMEGALKLKEISYIHAEAYPAGELKHGPLALVDEKMPVVCALPDDPLLEKVLSNLQEVRARGGELFLDPVGRLQDRVAGHPGHPRRRHRAGVARRRGVREVPADPLDRHPHGSGRHLQEGLVCKGRPSGVLFSRLKCVLSL